MFKENIAAVKAQILEEFEQRRMAAYQERSMERQESIQAIEAAATDELQQKEAFNQQFRANVILSAQ